MFLVDWQQLVVDWQQLEVEVQLTVAEKGHPPPPTATINRARLILNARGKDNKRARLFLTSARGRRHTARAVKQRAGTKI